MNDITGSNSTYNNKFYSHNIDILKDIKKSLSLMTGADARPQQMMNGMNGYGMGGMNGMGMGGMGGGMGMGGMGMYGMNQNPGFSYALLSWSTFLPTIIATATACNISPLSCKHI